MTRPLHVLAVNPGSTSTRISLFRDESLDLDVELRHALEDGAGGRFEDDLRIRIGAVRRWLDQNDVHIASLDAVVGRGGLLRPLEGGVYRVNESLLNDSRTGLQGRHPSNLGAHLAHELAIDAGAPAFVVDPVSVDEFDDLARLSGLAGIERRLVQQDVG